MIDEVSWTKLVVFAATRLMSSGGLRTFAPPSSEPVPLRNLTLGVLIVTGGTLAALPFRRQPIVPDATTNSSQATGPTESVLRYAPVYSQPHSQQSVASADPVPPARTLDQLVDELPTFVPEGPQPPERQNVSVPLSFEDLMQPMERPGPIAERFEAIGGGRQRVTGSLASSQPGMTFVARQPIGDVSSGGDVSASVEPLPPPDASNERNGAERHWIVQP